MAKEWGDLKADIEGEDKEEEDVAPEDKGTYDERNRVNELTGKEWIKRTKTVWFQEGLGKNHEEAQIEHEHPATFAYKDVKKLIEFFTKSEERVLDPFCGVASTQKACALSGRVGYGIELTKKWVELGEKRLEREVGGGAEQQHIIHGDTRDEIKNFEDEEFQYIVTSPPYWGILKKDDDYKAKERKQDGYDTKYSEDERDLGNLEDYSVFLTELKEIFRGCHRVLEDERYISVVVSDFRNKSEYIPFHQDMTDILVNVGFNLKGIKILVQNQKGLYPYGYPYSYVPNIHHQYIIIGQRA